MDGKRKWGSQMGYPKEEEKSWLFNLGIYVATLLKYYLATSNNFVG